MQARAFAAREDRLHHHQCGHVRGAIGRQRIAQRDRRQRGVGLVYRQRYRFGAHRLGRGDARDRLGGALDRREILLDPAIERGRIEIARDDEDRIVGPVISGVEGAHIVDRRGIEVGDAADHPAGIRVMLIGERRQIERIELAIGPGEHRLAEFLLHHVAFGGEAGRIDDQRGHAVGLGEQQPLQVVGGDDLEIIGVIVAGRGVVIAADILGQPVELLGVEVARRLEHQMLEQMRKARTPARIVAPADIVPHLHRDIGGRGVADRIDAQAIGERAFGEGDRLDRRQRRRRFGQRGRGDRGKQQRQEAAHGVLSGVADPGAGQRNGGEAECGVEPRGRAAGQSVDEQSVAARVAQPIRRP